MAVCAGAYPVCRKKAKKANKQMCFCCFLFKVEGTCVEGCTEDTERAIELPLRHKLVTDGPSDGHRDPRVRFGVMNWTGTVFSAQNHNERTYE